MNTETSGTAPSMNTLSTGTILDRIVAKKTERVFARREHRSPEQLRDLALSSPSVSRDFESALRAQTMSLITEIKRASPSKGLIVEDFQPVKQAQAYERGGAAAISVLTEQDFFLGSDLHLTDVVSATSVPVLRKDFIIDESQIYEARIMGASAILLIAAILPDPVLHHFMQIAASLGLSVLFEVHTMDELLRALELDAKIIGINNRDLHSFHVDISATERLAPMVPAGRIVVSESGIFTSKDVSRCYRCGVRAVLVGESLMREAAVSGSVEEKMHDLLSEIPRKISERN